MFVLIWIGAKSVGILQRLLVTCRLYAIDAYDYLAGAYPQELSSHDGSRRVTSMPEKQKQDHP